jgi:hypothetical protein
MDACATSMRFVTTLVLTTPASIAKNATAITATADAIAILVHSVGSIDSPYRAHVARRLDRGRLRG